MNSRSMGLSRLSRSKVGLAKKGPSCSANMILLALIVMAFAFSATMLVSFNSAIPTQNNGASVNNNIQYAPPPPLPPTPPESSSQSLISMGDLVTWMLLSADDKDYKTPDAALNRYHHDSPKSVIEFTPGSLKLSHAQTLQYCNTPPNIYRGHFQGGRIDGGNIQVSYSDKHKLAYVMLPKSGSSTARYMLKTEFHATETKKSLRHDAFAKGGEMEGVEVITFVRDPLSRFFSSYDEAYVRTAPWQTNNPHPFPYLHENLHSYHDYEDVFCPPSTRSNPTNRRECLFRPSQENGTLASRLERFVREYDGLHPFDIHLTLQVPMLSSSNGKPLHVTQIYNTTDSERGWKEIARQFLGEDAALGKTEQNAQGKAKGSGGVIEGRSYPRRFNSTLVSIETQRRICGLALLDYCCLNLPLPKVCKGAHYDGKELTCTLDKFGLIQPSIVPNEVN